MISVERSFLEKFPRLAQGRARAFSQPVIELLRRIACEERINRMLADIAPLTGFDFIERVLDYLHVSYSVANTDRENIPVDGRVVIVANHPLGALDAMALLQLVGSVRRDVRILANDVLLQFGQFDNLLLPVNVFGAEGSSSGRLREAYRALDREQALIVFPAGEVSRMGRKACAIRRGRRDSCAWRARCSRRFCRCISRLRTRRYFTARRCWRNRWLRCCWRAKYSARCGRGSVSVWARRCRRQSSNAADCRRNW
ncbi:GNAT family N-acetyltransferase [Pseudolysobacter antarcticus]|uniref:GNAT family N-acetyltransferase n=1 Tax=Pseudolysobacter antarcticus TaxID=2511995 RepID=UPI0030F384DD